MVTNLIEIEYKKENGLYVADCIKELHNEVPGVRETYPKYDNYGNPIHIIKDGIYNTVYLWGYKGKYIVAEIKNATYAEVKAALGNVAPESLSGLASPNMTTINGLRTRLTDASVTTYVYKPLYGIESVTDPGGITSYYTYDDLVV